MNSVTETVYRLTAESDTSGADRMEAALTGTNQSAKGLDATLKGASSQIKSLSTAAQQSASSISVLEKSTGNAEKVIADLFKEIERTKQMLEQFKQSSGQTAPIDRQTIASARLSKSMGDVSTSLAKAQLGFGGMSGPLGQVTSQIFNVTNAMENFEFMALRQGKSINLFSASVTEATGALGKMGTVGLVVGAAIAGWKIGTWIADVTGLGQAVEDTATRMIELGEAAERFATEHNTFVRTGQLGAAVMDKYSLSMREFDILMGEAKGTTAETQAIADRFGLTIADVDAVIKQASGSVTGLAAALFRLGNIAEQTGKSFEENYIRKVQEGNQKVLDFYKSNTELRDRALAEVQRLEARGLQNLSAVQRTELLKQRGIFEQHQLAVMGELKQAHSAQLKETVSYGSKRTSELERSLERQKAAWDKYNAYVTKVNQDTDIALAVSSGIGTDTGTDSSWADTFDASVNKAFQSNDKFHQSIVDGMNAAKSSIIVFKEYGWTLETNTTATEEAKDAVAEMTVEESLLFRQTLQNKAAFDALNMAINAFNPSLAGVLGLMKENVEESINWGETLLDLSGDLSVVSQTLGTLGGIFESEILNKASEAFDGAGQAAMGFGQIMSGDVLGGIQSVIMGVAKLFKALKDLFSHDYGKDVNKRLAEFLPGLQLSQDLIEQITQDAEELGNAGVALFLNLGAAIDEVGLNAQNANTFIGLLRNGFDLLNDGLITSQQLISAIDENFTDLAKASMDAFGLISNELAEVITLARQFGLEIPAITAFIESEISRGAEAINAMFERTTIKNEGQFNRFQTMLLGMVNAAIQSGMSFTQVMEMFGTSFESVAEAAERLGVGISVALQPFLDFQEITETFPNAVANLNDVVNIMQVLHNTQTLTNDAFKALERQGTKAAKKITQDGKLTAGEWATIAPYIMTAIEMSQRYGIELGRNTQELIDMAIEQGYLTDADAAPTLEESMLSFAEAIKETMEDIKEMIRLMLGLPDVDVNVNTNYTTTGTPPPTTGVPQNPKSRFRSFAGLRTPLTFQQPEIIQVHQGETLMPNPSISNSGSQRERFLQPIILQIDRRTLSQVIEEIDLDGTRNSVRGV